MTLQGGGNVLIYLRYVLAKTSGYSDGTSAIIEIWEHGRSFLVRWPSPLLDLEAVFF